MKTLLHILIIFLMTSIQSQACHVFDLGIMGTSCKADALIEIEILETKDSSDWKLYPNGFNHREVFRLLIDCKIVQSSSPELKDTVRLIFEFKSADYYDSLGNYELSICGDIMHTGYEFKFQQGEKYIAFVQKHPFYDEGKKEWWLLRAEKMEYYKAFLEFQSSRMINDYLKFKSAGQIDRDFLQKNKIFTSLVKNKDGRIEAVIFYNPYSSQFALIKKDENFESDPIVFDYFLKSFKIDKKYFIIWNGENWIKFKKENLQRIE